MENFLQRTWFFCPYFLLLLLQRKVLDYLNCMSLMYTLDYCDINNTYLPVFNFNCSQKPLLMYNYNVEEKPREANFVSF